MEPEPAVQRALSFTTIVLAALIAVAPLLAHAYLRTLPDRVELGPRTAMVELRRLPLDASGFAPLRLAGAWELASADPRFGGISGLAVDNGELLALTDSGVVIRLPRPGGRLVARLAELPGGPGSARFKRNRDSEALLKDPGGRGWWVAFEGHDQIWLYDPAFARPLARIGLPNLGLHFNRGIEGLAASQGRLLAFPEDGGRALVASRQGWLAVPFRFQARSVSEAAALPGDSLLLVERWPTLAGLANALVRIDRCPGGYCLAWRKRLPLGPFDNVEALAAEPLPAGATRLWMMTDDNLHRPFRTLLIAVDIPAGF